MEKDYNTIIEAEARQVFEIMQPRVSEKDLDRIKDAFCLAREAHAPQVRKGGEPYILHPISVARIAAHDMQLDADSVIAAFLHDVVEDTPHTIQEIEERFGPDVAYLVGVVTKQKSTHYEYSKQLDNYRQILDSVQKDIRPVLIKLADRLHNMRTLASMRPEKQMKIAGETDYFYAPMANRLGLYHIKTELENLSFKYRCPEEYENISGLIAAHVAANRENLDTFKHQIEDVLRENGIKARVLVDFRRPFSLWRKMHKFDDDFNHLKYRHFLDVVFEDNQSELSEKHMAMKIYCILTDRFKEKHNGMSNYVDSPKENGYQSIHVKLMPDFGRWQEVHISSERMIKQSQLGCLAENTDENIIRWIEKFRTVLRETFCNPDRGERYMEDVTSAFYNDDIQVFDANGDKVILPQNSTVIDFAYEVFGDEAHHASYVHINNRLDPVTTPLHRGDVVRVFMDASSYPDSDWEQFAHTYTARTALRRYRENLPKPEYCRCKVCNPIPGEEVIGISNTDGRCGTTVHKRDCKVAISLASSYGDEVKEVNFAPDETLYPVTLSVKAVDRHHLFIDLADCITNTLNLSMDSFNTRTERSIVVCNICFKVHSNNELRTIMNHISAIDGVDEVKRLK